MDKYGYNATIYGHWPFIAILTNLVADTATFPMQLKLFNLDYRLWRIIIVNKKNKMPLKTKKCSENAGRGLV